tara:strand:- start:592 stop:1278 length:687 start_codon:yes stop_codon:yes gene_type:complete
MYFPWIGIFEQMLLADVFVHYDDVQYPQGRSFISRVKIAKSPDTMWLTVPIKKQDKVNISQTTIDYSQSWQAKHLKSFAHFYAKAPFREDALQLVEDVFRFKDADLASLNIRAVEAVAKYFSIKTKTLRSSSLAALGASSDRLINIVKATGGSQYVTGHGAKKYLHHEQLEENGISVEYMNYENKAYPQWDNTFISHMSILDLIAYKGHSGIECIVSKTINWREFING